MRKIFLAAALAAMLMLAGCGDSREEPVPTPTPFPVTTPVPTPSPSPEPASQPGTVLASVVRPVYTYLSRGDKLSVVAALEDYYVVSLDGVNMLVDRRFICMDNVAPAKGWTGYATGGGGIFDSAFLTGDALISPQQNTPIDVLDQLGGIAFVKCGDVTGYMSLDMISETEIPSYSYGDYSNNDDSGAVSPGVQDGGEIALAYHGSTGGIVFLSTESSQFLWENKFVKPASATVFTDRLPVYLLELKRGDSVKVTAQSVTEWSVLCNEKIGSVPAGLIRLDSDGDYSPWQGFAAEGALLFSDYRLTGKATGVQLNTVVTVVDDLGVCYVVEVNGVTGYMAKSGVSESETVYYAYDGGGDSGGSIPEAPQEYTNDTM